MYGWRGKIGHVAPSRGDVLVYEFYQVAPKNIMFLNTTGTIRNIDRKNIERQIKAIESATLDLADTGSDIIFLGGGPIFTTLGYGSHDTICEDLSNKAGVPVVASIGADIEALKALSLKKLAIATPYAAEYDKKLVSFLEQAGFTIIKIKGLGITKNTEIGNLPAYASYELAKAMDRELQGSDYDGIYLPCMRWPTITYLEMLENDIDKPVISGSLATIWLGLNHLKIRDVELNARLLSTL